MKRGEKNNPTKDVGSSPACIRQHPQNPLGNVAEVKTATLKFQTSSKKKLEYLLNKADHRHTGVLKKPLMIAPEFTKHMTVFAVTITFSIDLLDLRYVSLLVALAEQAACPLCGTACFASVNIPTAPKSDIRAGKNRRRKPAFYERRPLHLETWEGDETERERERLHLSVVRSKRKRTDSGSSSADVTEDTTTRRNRALSRGRGEVQVRRRACRDRRRDAGGVVVGSRDLRRGELSRRCAETEPRPLSSSTWPSSPDRPLQDEDEDEDVGRTPSRRRRRRRCWTDPFKTKTKTKMLDGSLQDEDEDEDVGRTPSRRRRRRRCWTDPFKTKTKMLDGPLQDEDEDEDVGRIPSRRRRRCRTDPFKTKTKTKMLDGSLQDEDEDEDTKTKTKMLDGPLQDEDEDEDVGRIPSRRRRRCWTDPFKTKTKTKMLDGSLQDEDEDVGRTGSANLVIPDVLLRPRQTRPRYIPFTVTSHFPEALTKFYFQDIPPPRANKPLTKAMSEMTDFVDNMITQYAKCFQGGVRRLRGAPTNECERLPRHALLDKPLGVVRREHCTPVQSLALRGDGALDARACVALIDPAKQRVLEKTRRPTASSGTIPTCENPGVTRPRTEPGSPWLEANSLIAHSPRPLSGFGSRIIHRPRFGRLLTARSAEPMRVIEAKWRGKREMPERTRRPMALSGTIPTCGNPGVLLAGD
ncbi:hypothetical protein PR048_016659 [Dryococelus australis]|uniref:Uncharacterized protein n=1 Tax=Dryococelus australis TaxID=614101 RepID=A0ABQ9H7W1_9NEOP|nr:hypothetical protein PR048_016659 [Dryococelus australis]